MSFNLGRPILVLLVLAAICGLAIAMRPSPPRNDLVLWVFSDSHARTYRDPQLQPNGRMVSLIDQFRELSGLTTGVDLIGSRAEDIRLISMFMSQASGDRVPDLCEIEIGSVGKYFRPPIEDVGLLPLNDFLRQSGEYDRILKSRFAPWSKIDPRTGEQVIFGIPNDVHPIGLMYRKDLFDQAGVDIERAATWPEFQRLALQFQAYWKSHGRPDLRAIELFGSTPDILTAMLLQRHINIVDANNRVHFTDAKVAPTIAFYVRMREGPDAIGTDTRPSPLFARDLLDADVCALWTPDWRVGYVEHFGPELAGKVREMSLPRFDPDDAPTSTWGGTMLAIPRACRNPQAAWKLLVFMYLTPAGNAARMAASSNIIPPVPDLWADPLYHQPDPYFVGDQPGQGQKVEEFFVKLAPRVPARDVTPFTAQAQLALSTVLGNAIEYVRSNGSEGLEQACAGWLAEAQEQMVRRIQFGSFDQ